MKSVISFFLPVILTIAFSFIATDKAFSQSDREPNTTATSNSNGYVTGVTPARVRSLVGVAFGLSSLIIGWRVKSRAAAGANTRRSWTIIALVFGLAAVVLSVLHLTSTNGGFGTGGGKAGAIVALLLGVIGASLSWMALRFKQN